MFAERTIGPVEYEIDGIRVVHTCREHWIKEGTSIPARCGISGTLSFENSRGITAKEMRSLEDTVTGTFGVKGLASLETSVKESVASEVAISEQTTKTLTLACPAAKCGSVIYHLYQQVRDHQFDFHRPRFLRSPAVTTETPREYVGQYDFKIDKQPGDPNCPCPPEIDRTFAGTARVDANCLRITTEFERRLDGSLVIDIGETSHVLDHNTLTLPASAFPKGWRELAHLPADERNFLLPVEFLPQAEMGHWMMPQVIVPEDSGSGTNRTGGGAEAT